MNEKFILSLAITSKYRIKPLVTFKSVSDGLLVDFKPETFSPLFFNFFKAGQFDVWTLSTPAPKSQRGFQFLKPKTLRKQIRVLWGLADLGYSTHAFLLNE